MKIVILDGHTTTRDDLDFNFLEAFGVLEYYDASSPETLYERTKGAELILTNKCRFDDALFSNCPHLKGLIVLATGVDNIDLNAATRHGIVVMNVPSYSTPSVAQLVFSFILGFSNRVEYHSVAIRDGQWKHEFSQPFTPQHELKDKTLGLIGFGAIALQVAQIGHAFGMRIIVHTRTEKQTSFPIEFATFEKTLASSDFLSIHCPLTPETKHLLNASAFGMMKPSAVLINTARGAIVDEHALANALNDGVIAGAGLDVLTEEPPNPQHPLLFAKNVFLTPHMAWATHEARLRLLQIVKTNVKHFLNHSPVHVVNTEVLK